jgi:hypothetical protein
MRHDGYYGTKCKIEFTQLDLVTGIEKEVTYTAKSRVRDMFYFQDTSETNVEKLTKKINNWKKKNPNNIISSMGRIHCKSGDLYVHYIWRSDMEVLWYEYEPCDDRFTNLLIDNLNDRDKIGYKANAKKIIEKFPEGQEQCITRHHKFIEEINDKYGS